MDVVCRDVGVGGHMQGSQRGVILQLWRVECCFVLLMRMHALSTYLLGRFVVIRIGRRRDFFDVRFYSILRRKVNSYSFKFATKSKSRGKSVWATHTHTHTHIHTHTHTYTHIHTHTHTQVCTDQLMFNFVILHIRTSRLRIHCRTSTVTKREGANRAESI
jgi:hypothetical protein